MVSVESTEFKRVATTDEIPPGVMRKVSLDDMDVLVANVDGTYYAIGNLCTHHGGPLGEGTLRGHEVECPWHGSRFDLKTGSVTKGPARAPEPAYEIKVEGNNILLKPK